MSFTHSNSLGRYGISPLVVATNPAHGSHTTLASALAAATAGQTVVLRDSVTENVTLPADVNIASWQGSANNTPSITGKITFSAAGTNTISGVTLKTNLDNFLAITGSAASVLNLDRCYLNCTDATGITFSSSSSSAKINIQNSKGNIGTTGISLFSHSSAGEMNISDTRVTNTGLTTTASTVSAGILNITNGDLIFPITTSGTSSLAISHTIVSNAGTNTTSLTVGGSGIQKVSYSELQSGSASAVSISTSAILENCIINSSNTNTITGAGTLIGNNLLFSSTSSGVNVTTQTPKTVGIQGLWTPNLQINNSSTGITYGVQEGGYAIIGNVVNVWGKITLTSKGASVGIVTINNFPVRTGATGLPQVISVGRFNQVTKAGYTTLGINFANTSTTGQFILSSASGSGVIGLTDTDMSNTFNCHFSGTYIVQ